MFDIQEELLKLPTKPGVYLMKSFEDEIIYVGKAINLRSRVRSYFRESSKSDLKVSTMVKHIKEFEYIVTDSELEALILECNLIKEHKPKYNILLKDDKSYPYIKITLKEKYPRVLMVRKHKKDGSKFFGPYTSIGAVRETLELIHNLWEIRTCQKIFPRDVNKERPCLNHHIGKCLAPCTGSVDEEIYNKMIIEAIGLLNGKHDKIINKLNKEMEDAAIELEFEAAADLRDKISAVKELSEKQKIDSYSSDEQDVIAFAKAEGEALFQIFVIRGGKMIGREHFLIENVGNISRQEVMSGFLKQFYNETSFLPKEILIEDEIVDKEIMQKWLSTLKGTNVTITVPQKGQKYKLIELAHKNAILTLEQFGEKFKREQEKTVGALREIQEVLGTERELKRIEAYDISNIHGVQSVASMIVFEMGKPKRSDYRKFKIKGVEGIDDYASMEEVLTRRFLRYKKEQNENNNSKTKFSSLPDIIFVDGGRGHITTAEKVLQKLELNIPIAGMVKDDRHRTRGIIFQNKEINFKITSEGFKLITRIQDEVHRFAIEYHRKLREKILIKSELDDIPNIAEIRKKNLMKHFGSIDKIKKAEINELLEVESIDSRSANSIYEYFRK